MEKLPTIAKRFVRREMNKHGNLFWVIPVVMIFIVLSIWFASYRVASNVEAFFGTTLQGRYNQCLTINEMREQTNSNAFVLEEMIFSGVERSLDLYEIAKNAGDQDAADLHLSAARELYVLNSYVNFLPLNDCEALYINGNGTAVGN